MNIAGPSSVRNGAPSLKMGAPAELIRGALSLKIRPLGLEWALNQKLGPRVEEKGPSVGNGAPSLKIRAPWFGMRAPEFVISDVYRGPLSSQE